jgi:muconolactone delta-isomerase
MSRFLVIQKATGPTPPPNSPDFAEMGKLLLSEFEFELKLQKEGKIVAGGTFLDIRGGCGIIEVDSVEELGEIFFNSPLNPWIDREVHPLGKVEDTLAGMKEMLAGTSRKG